MSKCPQVTMFVLFVLFIAMTRFLGEWRRWSVETQHTGQGQQVDINHPLGRTDICVDQSQSFTSHFNQWQRSADVCQPIRAPACSVPANRLGGGRFQTFLRAMLAGAWSWSETSRIAPGKSTAGPLLEWSENDWLRWCLTPVWPAGMRGLSWGCELQQSQQERKVSKEKW